MQSLAGKQAPILVPALEQVAAVHARRLAQTRHTRARQGFAWRAVHLALLPTNEYRAKAIVDWAGETVTHQRVGRITVRTDEGD